MHRRLAGPLTDPQQIAPRLDAVGFFLERGELREQIRTALRSAPDLARASGRLALGRGGPRDLAAIRGGLAAARNLRRLVGKLDEVLQPSPGELTDAEREMAARAEEIALLHDRLERLLVAEPPFFARDGGFIVSGAHAALDEARSLRDQSRRVIAELEARYRTETGIASLKIKHNAVLGYFIEVTAAQSDRLLQNGGGRFRHRQTIASAVRFSTDELNALAVKIGQAGEQALAIELDLFDVLVAQVRTAAMAVSAVADAMAVLDVASALAELANRNHYCRPIVEDSLAFDVVRGRHPVVEQALAAENDRPFTANDCELSPRSADGKKGRLWLITGPNMAGKSTFLRQNAILTIMAQMGSYVPAESARIGAVDKLFSRVGAADDLARGRSTFMVEMVETAAILNQATERSLVILDEIGRGTATFDGLSIAWAVVEYLHEVSRCRALFATHYHELTALTGRLGQIGNVTMDVKEWRDEIVFLHKVKPGAADRSYGIQVAKLAGLPKPVTARAAEVLALLEKSEGKSPDGESLLNDLPLFAAARPKSHIPAAATSSPVDEALAAINPDELTPKGALEALYRLKELTRKDRG
jgi:DNA mismatch repair protein MutS